MVVGKEDRLLVAVVKKEFQLVARIRIKASIVNLNSQLKFEQKAVSMADKVRSMVLMLVDISTNSEVILEEFGDFQHSLVAEQVMESDIKAKLHHF